jgi:hypothetical protein
MMPPPSNAAGSTFRLGGTLTIPRLSLGRCSCRADATGPPSITPRRWRSRAAARPDRGDGGRARPDQLCPVVGQNLRELGVDVLDLVYLRVGRLLAMGADPIGERFAALAELRDEGLIRHLRISNVTRSRWSYRSLGPGTSAPRRTATMPIAIVSQMDMSCRPGMSPTTMALTVP